MGGRSPRAQRLIVAAIHGQDAVELFEVAVLKTPRNAGHVDAVLATDRAGARIGRLTLVPSV
jgi:hypothetical protein